MRRPIQKLYKLELMMNNVNVLSPTVDCLATYCNNDRDSVDVDVIAESDCPDR